MQPNHVRHLNAILIIKKNTQVCAHSPVQSRGIAHQIAQKSTNKKPKNRTNQHEITELNHYLLLVVDRHAFVSLRYGHSHRRPACDWVDRGLWR